MLVLGIDAGGTKTVCQLADEQGGVLAESRGPGANLQVGGELEVEKTLHQVMDGVLAQAAVAPSAVCLGMAGVDRPEDAAVVRGLLTRISHRARLLVVNDALIALEAGAPRAPGLVIVAGTGSIAYGRDAGGHAARAGGWGYVLGDEGSGYWLGRQALRAVVRAADRRGPETRLTPRVFAHYGVKGAPDLVHALYGGGLNPPAIAALAANVEAAAEEGDAVALHIVRAGAEELASLAASVARRLDLHDQAVPVVLAGGILHALPQFRTRVTLRVGELLPRAVVTPLAVEPALGAARLALRFLQGENVVPTYRDSPD
jgi:N-acetylglucosamine kinase-like BadF-type ATPase